MNCALFIDPLNKRVIANQCAHWCGNPQQVSGNLGGSPRQPIVWLGIDELFKQFVKLEFALDFIALKW